MFPKHVQNLQQIFQWENIRNLLKVAKSPLKIRIFNNKTVPNAKAVECIS